MKRGWTPELERLVRRVDTVARLIPEVVVTSSEDVRDRSEEWLTADSLAGLRVRVDGGVEMDGQVQVMIESTASAAYMPDLQRAGQYDAAALEWPAATVSTWMPRIIDVHLVAQRDPLAPKTVARWAMQLQWLQGHNRTAPAQAELEQDQVFALHEPVYVDALGGINPGLVRFDLSALGVEVRKTLRAPVYIGSTPSSAQQLPPTAYVHVWGVRADGSAADNCGWSVDTTRAVHESAGVRAGRRMIVAEDGRTHADYVAGVPRMAIYTEAPTPPAIVGFTGAGNLIDLGAAPANDVELVAQGETPAGTSITFEVQADDGAWVAMRDGDLAGNDNRPAGGSDLSAGSAHPVTRRRTYRMRARLARTETGGPIVRAVGARAVRLRLMDGDATWEPRGEWAIDPVTLRAEVMEGSLIIPRTGAADARDIGSELFATSYTGELLVRIWLGHPSLARSAWMLVDAHLVEDYDAVGPAIVATTVSVLATTRVKLPPAIREGSAVTRTPITYVNQLLATAWSDLLDSVIAVPERYRGEGIPDSIPHTVSKRIQSGEGKAELDALSRLAGGATVASQGRIKWVPVLGARDVVAVFPSEEIRAVRLTPGLRQRVPEFFVPYNWRDDDAEGGSGFGATVRSFNQPGLRRLGTVTLDAPRELPDDVARWIDSDQLAEGVARDTTETLGLGLMLLGFEAVYPHPELEPGDVVALETRAFVGRDPITDRELRGRMWVTAVVQSVADAMGRLLSVWVRRYSDITVGAERVNELGGLPANHYDLYDPRFVSELETATHYAFTVSRGAGVEQVWYGVMEFEGAWSADKTAAVKAALHLAEPGENVVMVPKPGQDRVAILWVQAVSYLPGGEQRDRGGIEVPVYGTAAPIGVAVEVTEAPDGTSAVVSVRTSDPRGVVSGVEIWTGAPDEPEAGPYPMLGWESVWSFGVDLFADHVVHVRGRVLRTDGGLPLTWGPVTLGTARIPGIPGVRVTRLAGQDVLLVDGADANSATLHWAEVNAGTVGPTSPVPARGGGGRFGVLALMPSVDGRDIRVWARNPQGVPGLYAEVRLAAADPAPITVPAYATCVTRVIDSDADLALVAVAAQPPGASVRLIGVTGSAVRVGGPLPNAAAASGTTWLFARGEAESGLGQAEFEAYGAGLVPDSGMVLIPERGRDTVALLALAEVIDETAETLIVRVRGADPYPGGAITVSAAGEGTSGITPSSAVIAPADVTASTATTGFVLFTVPKPSSPELRGARALFVVTRVGRVEGRDHVTVPPLYPPVFREEPSEDGATGYLTLVPLAGAVFDGVEFSSRTGGDAYSGWVASAPDGAGNYIGSVALSDKHPSAIQYRVVRAGAVIQQRAVQGYDLGQVATVKTAHPAYDGGVARITVTHDTDTVTGPSAGQYTVNSGPVLTYAIDSQRVARIDVAQSETARRMVHLRGRNAAGVPGPWRELELDRWIRPPGPALSSVGVYVQDDGYEDIYNITVRTTGGPTAAGYSLVIQPYRAGNPSGPPVDGLDPTLITYQIRRATGDGLANLHHVSVELRSNGSAGETAGAPITTTPRNSIPSPD